MMQKTLEFRKSSYSANNVNCVEVADLDECARAFRDSTQSDHEYLAFPPAEWRAFLHDVKHGGL